MNAPRSPWPAALLRLTVATLLFGALGLLTGQVLLSILLGTLGYLAWNLTNQIRLERWLREGRKLEPPVSSGLWGEIFNGIHRLQRRQRKRRRKLARILQGVRETINAMPDGAVILGESGAIQWWNGAARSLLGLTWPADEGQRIGNLFRHPQFSAFLSENPEHSQGVITVPSPVDEDIMLEVRVIPYGRNQRLLLARDITRLYRLERMRRDFVANISHELRTPLTVIHGLSESLSDSPAAGAPGMQRPLELIEQQTQRMQRLVEDLLLLSRLETEERPAARELVDIPRLLRVLAEETRTLSGERKHRIALDVDPELCLLGDESELRSALSNLVFNAVKYTPGGGEIRIIWLPDKVGRAMFAVEDTGIGIPPHHLPRLTERFYRVDTGRSARSGGTGLGLAIVKHILGRYGSRLEITSDPGVGSRFACSFPQRVVTRHASTTQAGESGA
ncbi:MAG: phosphate regulon sensor histidine kinase PhoR [Aquisalimonadaceae bacterium]